MQYLSFYCLLYSFFKCRNTFIIKLTHVYNNNVNVCGSCVVVRRPALLWTPEAFPGANLRFPRKAGQRTLDTRDFPCQYPALARQGKLRPAGGRAISPGYSGHQRFSLPVP